MNKGVLAGLMGAVLVLAAAGGHARVTANSPTGQVLVVTANLKEGFNDRDLRNMREVKVFATRVLDQVPYVPDVLLLQEVRKKSAHYVAEVFSNRTDQTFVVAVDAGRRAWSQTSTRIVKKDTAIVINASAMMESGRDGYITTVLRRADGKPEYKKNARTQVQERESDTRVALVSVHVPPAGTLAASEKLARKLKAAYGGDTREHFRVIAGDFNQSNTSDGRKTKFWRVLTGKYDYLDTLWTFESQKGVDLIFAWRTALDAGWDSSYNRNVGPFYSDHAFRWALIGPDYSPPSAPQDLDARAWDDFSKVRLSWTASSDEGGTGVKAYELWRSRDGGRARRVKTYTKPPPVWDKSTESNRRYTYFVRARDYVGNRSAKSNEDSVTAGTNDD